MLVPRSRRIALPVLAVALALTLGAAGFLLLSPPARTDRSHGDPSDLSAAMREDAAFIAESSGEDEADVLARLALQEHVNEVVDPIIQAHPDLYAGAGFDGDSAYVAFTGPLPADARATLDAHPEITVMEDAGLTPEEADRLTAELFELVIAGIPDDESAFAHVDPVTGAVEVATSVPLSESVQESVRSRADDAAAPAVTFLVDASLMSHADGVGGTGGPDAVAD